MTRSSRDPARPGLGREAPGRRTRDCPARTRSATTRAHARPGPSCRHLRQRAHCSTDLRSRDPGQAGMTGDGTLLWRVCLGRRRPGRRGRPTGRRRAPNARPARWVRTARQPECRLRQQDEPRPCCRPRLRRRLAAAPRSRTTRSVQRRTRPATPQLAGTAGLRPQSRSPPPASRQSARPRTVSAQHRAEGRRAATDAPG